MKLLRSESQVFRASARFCLLGMALSLSLAACGGGGGGAGGGNPGGGLPPVSATPTPTPAPTLPPSSSQTGQVGASGPSTITLTPISPGISGAVTFPAAQSGSSQLTLTLETQLPTGYPVPQSVPKKYLGSSSRRPANLGAAVNALAYITVVDTTAFSLASTPSLTMSFPSVPSGFLYLVAYEPTGWTAVSGPVSATSATVTFAATTTALAFPANSTALFAVITTGAALPTPTPSPTPTPTAAPTATPTPASSASPGAAATLSPISTNSNTGGWAPYASANAFQFPVQSGYNGSGETLGIIIDAIPSSSDIAAYLAEYGITQTGTISNEPANGGSKNAPSGEETLDTETIASLAPGANIIVYDIPDLSNQSLADAFNKAVSDNRAAAVNMSFGGCETAYDKNAFSPIFQRAAQAGMAFVASAGDSGADCSNGSVHALGVNYPASDPNVIGVGGTETITAITSTAAWNDKSCSGGFVCATGGGISTIFPLPTYQQGLGGVASTRFRNVPDVAMPGENDAIYLNGQWLDVNGTSWSAPLFVAMLGEIDQYCSITTSPPNATAALYSAFGAKGYNDFSDVVSGDNTYGTVTGYNAGVGYDNVSGIGIPLGMPLAQTFCPNRVLGAVARRSSIMSSGFETLAPASARTLPPAPSMQGMQVIGNRSASQTTRIALVLLPAANVADNEATVLQLLRSAGFTIVGTYSDHLVIDAEAPANLLGRFFATTIQNVNQPGYGARYVNANPLVLPASIAPYVSGVIADNLVTMKRI